MFFWQTALLANPRASNPGFEIDRSGAAVFQLRDFLSPGGRYKYDDLPKWMEQARNDGRDVYLMSVPGFLMVSGHPGSSKKPWSDADSFRPRRFRTAREAIRG